MFEIVYFTVATLFAGDMANTEFRIAEQLADNRKVERIHKKIARVQKSVERVEARLEWNPKTLSKADLERKARKNAKKLAKYNLQLQFVK